MHSSSPTFSFTPPEVLVQNPHTWPHGHQWLTGLTQLSTASSTAFCMGSSSQFIKKPSTKYVTWSTTQFSWQGGVQSCSEFAFFFATHTQTLHVFFLLPTCSIHPHLALSASGLWCRLNTHLDLASDKALAQSTASIILWVHSHSISLTHCCFIWPSQYHLYYPELPTKHHAHCAACHVCRGMTHPLVTVSIMSRFASYMPWMPCGWVAKHIHWVLS